MGALSPPEFLPDRWSRPLPRPLPRLRPRYVPLPLRFGFVLEGGGASWRTVGLASPPARAGGWPGFFGVGAVLYVSSMPRARLRAFSAAALLCSAFSAENFFASETALSVSSFQILWMYALSWLDSLALEMFCCISDCILDCSVLSCSMTFE